MSNEEKATRDRIHEVATRTFLEKGFRDASLRGIVKEAGVTTGSFYWYYKSKEELFDALVGEHYRHIMQMYQDSLDAFWAMSKEEQKEHMGEIGGQCMVEMVQYMYQYPIEFKLLFTASSGTKYENMLHELVEIEVTNTNKFMEHMRQIGVKTNDMDPELEYIITSGMFAAMVELVIRDTPSERVLDYMRQLHDFYTAGWRGMMGM